MHPQNIFSEAVLLFVIGILLILRDRGSAEASTNYDHLLAGILLVMALIRLCEFMSGAHDGFVMGRAIVWSMWLIPLLLFVWMTVIYQRLDTGVMSVVCAIFLIVATLCLINGMGGYDLIPPNLEVGASSGIYQWIRTDGSATFMPFGFYVLLTIALIYLTALSLADRVYWIFAAITAAGFLLGAVAVPHLIMNNPSATLGSLSTLVMLAVGVVAIILVPG